MVGSAIFRALKARGNAEIITRSRADLNLLEQRDVRDFMHTERPDAVILAAAKVGGILANDTYPAQFIYENLMMEANVIHEAYSAGVERLLFLGSSCIYPKLADQPMAENALMTGTLEPTNEPYAIAKIAGIKLCESYNRQYGTDYRSVMPTNLYGPGDNFHPENSHVLPALLRKFHTAVQNGNDEVIVWGSGAPKREFLFVDDLASACLHVMDSNQYHELVQPMQSHVNVGTGSDVSIRELAETIARIVGFKGRITFDRSKPDGAPRKLMNVDLLSDMGWKAQTCLDDGIQATYRWFLDNINRLRQA